MDEGLRGALIVENIDGTNYFTFCRFENCREDNYFVEFIDENPTDFSAYECIKGDNGCDYYEVVLTGRSVQLDEYGYTNPYRLFETIFVSKIEPPVDEFDEDDRPYGMLSFQDKYSNMIL